MVVGGAGGVVGARGPVGEAVDGVAVGVDLPIDLAGLHFVFEGLDFGIGDVGGRRRRGGRALWL